MPKDTGGLPEDEEEALYRIAKWMKAHRGKYAPLDCVNKMPNYRGLLKELRRKGLIGTYKGGKTVFPTEDGWLYITARFPELSRRGRTIHFD